MVRVRSVHPETYRQSATILLFLHSVRSQLPWPQLRRQTTTALSGRFLCALTMRSLLGWCQTEPTFTLGSQSNLCLVFGIEHPSAFTEFATHLSQNDSLIQSCTPDPIRLFLPQISEVSVLRAQTQDLKTAFFSISGLHTCQNRTARATIAT